MGLLDQIAEARIRDAIARGVFDDLPGKGRPLQLDDVDGVPDELRASYRVLRNAGFLPEELELRRESLRLRDLIDACCDDRESLALRRELNTVQLRIDVLTQGRGLNIPATYRDQVTRALSGRRS